MVAPAKEKQEDNLALLKARIATIYIHSVWGTTKAQKVLDAFLAAVDVRGACHKIYDAHPEINGQVRFRPEWKSYPGRLMPTPKHVTFDSGSPPTLEQMLRSIQRQSMILAVKRHGPLNVVMRI